MTSTAGVAPVAETSVAPQPDETRRRGPTGYLLIIPGLAWLLLFFVVPFYSLVASSLYDPDGGALSGFQMTYHWQNFTDAFRDNWDVMFRSLWYAGVATGICLVIGYVLAYAIAFKAGRWRNLLLVLVIAPFFTSFLLRTLSWKLSLIHI